MTYVTIGGSSTSTTDPLPVANTIDATQDLLAIYTASLTATQAISRNTLLGITGNPVGTTDSQSVSNKTLGNTNTITLKDTLFTLQDDGDTTKQAQFQLSSITTATTRTLTVPDASGTLALLSAAQTMTNKTLTSPTINSPTITNATISADAVTGFSTSTNGTIYGMSVTGGVLASAALNNAVNTAALQNASVTPDKLSLGPQVANVASDETTTSTSYTNLATTSDTVTLTIGANGLALVILTSGLYNVAAGDYAYVSFAASGANTIAASDTRALATKTSAGSEDQDMSWMYLATGLTPGSTTFKMKYRVNGGTGHFHDRYITVIPL